MAMARSHLNKIVRYRIEGPITTTTTTATTATTRTTPLEPIRLTLDDNFGKIVLGLGLVAIVLLIIFVGIVLLIKMLCGWVTPKMSKKTILERSDRTLINFLMFFSHSYKKVSNQVFLIIRITFLIIVAFRKRIH